VKKMKRIFFVLIALCFMSALAFAEDVANPVVATQVAETAAAVPAVATTPEVLTLKGDVIDNLCAGMNQDTLAEFVKTHTKQCATKQACMDSGYSILADGKLYKFDKDSSAKVAEFLKTADSKLQVTVTAKQVGDELSLVSIENQN
jgi:hypothetical protein